VRTTCNLRGIRTSTSSTKSRTLSLHHSAWYEGETLCGFTCLDFTSPLQRGEKIGFSSQRIRKSFTSGFEFVFPSALPLAHPILCHGIYCALCLARSSRQRVKNACIGPGVRKEKIYTASRWETLRHSASSKVHVLYNFMTEKKICFASYGAHVLFQNYTSWETGSPRVMEGNKVSHTSEIKLSL
jgi:hypothetical protein